MTASLYHSGSVGPPRCREERSAGASPIRIAHRQKRCLPVWPPPGTDRLDLLQGRSTSCSNRSSSFVNACAAVKRRATALPSALVPRLDVAGGDRDVVNVAALAAGA